MGIRVINRLPLVAFFFSRGREEIDVMPKPRLFLRNE